jgi:SOS response regulatory protein OraA/RecX
MKTNNIQFATLAPLMLAVHKGESKLVAALVTLRSDHKALDDKEFAEAFIAFGEGLDYSTKWLGDILRDAGIRRRAAGAGRKPASPAEKKDKQAEAFTAWLAAMPKDLTAKQVKAVTAKLAKA